jgi:AcrR family transcriptional regulator
MRAKRGGEVVPPENLPVELRRLWGLAVAFRRGRPAQLDVERVVRAAVALADHGGLAQVTLPGIAKALGYTTMSLYRHVGSKDELLGLMQDFAIATPPPIAIRPKGWRSGLRRWAHAQRLLNQRRPWLARVPIAGPPSGPNQLAWLECALRILRGTGLDWAEKVGIVSLVGGYVRNATLLAQDLEHGRRGAEQGQTEERYARSLAKLIDPREFPETAELFASGLFRASRGRGRADSSADPDFTFGLERILDGAAACIARRRRGRPGRASSVSKGVLA